MQCFEFVFVRCCLSLNDLSVCISSMPYCIITDNNFNIDVDTNWLNWENPVYHNVRTLYLNVLSVTLYTVAVDWARLHLLFVKSEQINSICCDRERVFPWTNEFTFNNLNILRTTNREINVYFDVSFLSMSRNIIAWHLSIIQNAHVSPKSSSFLSYLVAVVNTIH